MMLLGTHVNGTSVSQQQLLQNKHTLKNAQWHFRLHDFGYLMFLLIALSLNTLLQYVYLFWLFSINCLASILTYRKT